MLPALERLAPPCAHLMLHPSETTLIITLSRISITHQNRTDNVNYGINSPNLVEMNLIYRLTMNWPSPAAATLWNMDLESLGISKHCLLLFAFNISICPMNMIVIVDIIALSSWWLWQWDCLKSGHVHGRDRPWEWCSGLNQARDDDHGMSADGAPE